MTYEIQNYSIEKIVIDGVVGKLPNLRLEDKINEFDNSANLYINTLNNDIEREEF